MAAPKTVFIESESNIMDKTPVLTRSSKPWFMLYDPPIRPNAKGEENLVKKKK